MPRCGARGLRRLGGRIHENSPVIRLDTVGRPRLSTPDGEVTATYAVLAGSAYLGDLAPRLAARLIPVSTFIIATEPLGEARAREVILRDYAFTDWRYILESTEGYTRRLAEITVPRRAPHGNTAIKQGQQHERPFAIGAGAQPANPATDR